MAISALVFVSRILDSLYMLRISTFVISLITNKYLAWIKLLLVSCLLLIGFT